MLNKNYDNDHYYNEYDKSNQHSYKSILYPSLKELSRVALDSNEKWKILVANLKYQLSKIQTVKDAMDKRTTFITKFTSNWILIQKKNIKQEK